MRPKKTQVFALCGRQGLTTATEAGKLFCRGFNPRLLWSMPLYTSKAMSTKSKLNHIEAREGKIRTVDDAVSIYLLLKAALVYA